MAQNKNFKELLADVEAIVFDVDGVMTDGGIMPLADGDFIRKYNAKDGYALAYAASHGFNIGVISGGFGKAISSTDNLSMSSGLNSNDIVACVSPIRSSKHTLVFCKYCPSK